MSETQPAKVAQVLTALLIDCVIASDLAFVVVQRTYQKRIHELIAFFSPSSSPGICDVVATGRAFRRGRSRVYL
jgi:hypothetical protein